MNRQVPSFSRTATPRPARGTRANSPGAAKRGFGGCSVKG